MKRQELIDQIFSKGTFLCVGLDTDVQKLPQCLLRDADGREVELPEAMLAFNKAVIDATAPYCVAYKPNLAFYEDLGPEGLQVLDETVRYIHSEHPHHMVIADAKRGDIGNTARLYARAFFETMGCDAVTVAPYMGSDSVKPFLAYADRDKWTILLAVTSNPSADEFETSLNSDGYTLWERVLEHAVTWGTRDNLMFVVGATRSDLFNEVRCIARDHFLLVPGIGAQGGSLEDVCRFGLTRQCGLLVNSSRAIIFASSGEDFAEAAAREAAKLAAQMKQLLADRLASPRPDPPSSSSTPLR